MNVNKKLIEQFYTAFAAANADKMNACYHDNIEFSDPAFGQLKGEKAKAMWAMLCQNGKDLKVTLVSSEAYEKEGTAQWNAKYIFSKTGREVENIIHAKFKFAEGKIIKHDDTFNLRKWAGQAMGIKGKILGGTRFFRERLQEQTNYMLKKYMENKAKH